MTTSAPITTTLQTRRIGQMIYLRPECMEEYKAIHAAVWPEVLEQIKDSGISDYSIHLIPALPSPSPTDPTDKPMLFATFKYTGSDFDADMARMAANPKVQEWWRLTDAMQETAVEGSTGSTDRKGWWLGCDEVFYAS